MMARFIASRRRAAPSSGWKAWASRRVSRLITSAICTLATAAARFSRSARAGKYLCSPRLNPRSPHIIWRFISAVTCTFPGRRHQVLTASTASQGGEVSVFFRGLGRPQGIALDRDGNLYVAASYGGRRGIVRITPQAQAEVVLSGSGIVGMALQPSGRAILATTDALFTLDWDVRGLPLIG